MTRGKLWRGKGRGDKGKNDRIKRFNKKKKKTDKIEQQRSIIPTILLRGESKGNR